MRGQCLVPSAVEAFTYDSAISSRFDGTPGK